VNSPIAYFSVKYRLGPEVEYPTGAKDGKAAIEYFFENSEKHGCDPSKLCVTGESAGGWIAMVAAILLAKEDKCDKVKLMILTCPMLGALVAQKIPKEEVEDWEKPQWDFRKDYFEMHTKDVDANLNDPLLFPFTLPVEDMKKLP